MKELPNRTLHGTGEGRGRRFGINPDLFREIVFMPILQVFTRSLRWNRFLFSDEKGWGTVVSWAEYGQEYLLLIQIVSRANVSANVTFETECGATAQ